MSEITAIVNQKGGTGKTTTTLNLGSALARLGKKVLLIDLDPQANLSYSLGLNDPAHSIADVFQGACRVDEAMIQKENMHIVPATIELADIEISLVDMPERECYLANVLRDQTSFDHILIDAPPTLSLLTVNALFAADNVLISMLPDVLSLRGLIQLLATIDDFRDVFGRELPVKGIVAVRCSRRTTLFREVMDQIKENVDEYLFPTSVRENVKVAEAPSYAQSVIAYAPRSNGALDYMTLAEEFLSQSQSQSQS